MVQIVGGCRGNSPFKRANAVRNPQLAWREAKLPLSRPSRTGRGHKSDAGEARLLGNAHEL
jgi:hypothetical protein